MAKKRDELVEQFETYSKVFSIFKQNLAKEFQKKKKKTFSDLKNEPDFKQYKKVLSEMKIRIKYRKEEIERINNLEEKVTLLTKDLDQIYKKNELDFVITHEMTENVRKHFQTIQELEQNLVLIDSYPFKKKVRELLNETLNPVKQEFQGQNKKIKGYKNRLQTKLKLMEDISQIELFIDETLGKFFGQVQSLENEKRCFSTSQASSIVFTLVKMNSIIYEKNFLDSFLNTLSFNIAKEFMVFNYAIFTDQGYVANIINNDDYIEGLQHYREERRKETIINYISNWSLVVNDFKDTTEYSTKKDTVSRFRRFGSLFRRGLTWIWKKVLGFKMDTLDNIYFSIFFKSLFASLTTACFFSNLIDFNTEIVGH